MPWFYANAGQQVGPVADTDLERLAREGVVQPTTLVWREGMPAWASFSSVGASFAPTVISDAAPGNAPPCQAVCHECGKLFSAEETMQISGATICAACKPVYLQKMREGATPLISTPGQFRYGGFWIRVAAKIIDSVIIGIPMMLLYFAAAFLFGVGTYTMKPGALPDWTALLASLGLQLAVQFIAIVLGGFYNVYFVVKYGATPGKRIVGLRVITPDGLNLTVGRAIGRYFAEMVSGLACYIGYIIVAFDDQKRALHDHMCNTRVVYK